MVENRACRVCGVVVAAGIGLALSSGSGVAAASPPGAESSSNDASSEPAQSSSPGDSAGAANDQETGPGDPETDSGADEVGETPTDPDEDVAVVDDEGPDPESTTEEDDRTDSTGTDMASTAAQSSSIADGVDPLDSADPNADVDAEEPTGVEGFPVAQPTPVVDAVAPPPTSPPAATAAPARPDPVPVVPARFVSKLLNPFAIPVAPGPGDSPLLWAVLAWARRQFVDAPAPGRPSTSTSTSSSTTSAVNTVNVRDYGAVGDGVADDSAAIKAAEAALTSGGRLYFPEGDYRFAQQHPAGGAAVVLKGLSNVTVEFEPGARLVMDNLAANGHGTSHGIRVEGAASHVTLLNPTVEWTISPSARSFGDGISVLGWPSDTPPPPGWTGSTGTVEFVSIVNARVVNAPQTGAVIMGASDVTVIDFTAIGTKADGLHFNANRRVTVDGLVAVNTGDDGLAFVTYHHETQLWTYGPTDGPFNQSGLSEWNNSDSVASRITVTGGNANGFRIQGGYDITISGVTVTDKDFGFHVNSSKAAHAGDWTSLASRDIRISDVVIDGAQTGVVLATNNIDGTEDQMWWNFSGLTISDVTIRGSKNWSLAVEAPHTTTSAFAGVTLRNIYAESMVADGPTVGGNGGILLTALRDSVIDNVRLVSDHPADINLLGAPQMRNHLSVADLPSSNLTVNDLILEGPGRILIQDIAGVQFGNVSSSSADGAAVVLYRVKNASFDNITAYMPGRGAGAGFGVQILQVVELDIANIAVTMDDHTGSSWWAIELGGGGSDSIAGQGVRIENVTYVSDRDDTNSYIVVQGGPYGPADWYISVQWLHNGEAAPQWRSALYGDWSPL